MIKTKKNITVNGTITADERAETIMTVSANIPDDGAASISKYIQNKELYLKNKETINKDLADFEAEIESLMGL